MNEDDTRKDRSLIETVTQAVKTATDRAIGAAGEALVSAVTPSSNAPQVIIDPGSGTAVVTPLPERGARRTETRKPRARKSVLAKKASAAPGRRKGKAAKKAKAGSPTPKTAKKKTSKRTASRKRTAGSNRAGSKKTTRKAAGRRTGKAARRG